MHGDDSALDAFLATAEDGAMNGQALTVRYFSRDVYGTTRLYVTDGEVSAALMALTRRRTIEARDLDALRALGHSVERVADPKHAPMVVTVEG